MELIAAEYAAARALVSTDAVEREDLREFVARLFAVPGVPLADVVRPLAAQLEGGAALMALIGGTP